MNTIPDLPTRLSSQRLLLRRYEPGDGAMYFAVGQKNRAHLQRYESENCILQPRNEAEAEALVQELVADWTARRCFMMGAFDRATGEFVAQIYIGVIDWNVPEIAVGYFVDGDHQGQGFVTEAVQTALGFIFEHLGAHRVQIECDDTNVRSYRVAERCGFVREGHLRENKQHPDGSRSGTFYYGLLKSEYRPANSVERSQE